MSAGRVLVYGGRGALGSAIVDVFKAKEWWTCNVDLAVNAQADVNVIVKHSAEFEQQAGEVSEQVEKALDGNKLDAVLCVAGGWAGGNASAEDFLRGADLMWRQSVWSSLIATRLATSHLKEGGLLQLTGAKAALEATPTMMGYGMAKVAVHHLVRSLASSRSGLPAHTTTVAILPVTLDTPANRHSMPKADFSTWTPLDWLAQQLFQWANQEDSRPATGSLVQLITKDGKTDLVIGQLQHTTPMAMAY